MKIPIKEWLLRALLVVVTGSLPIVAVEFWLAWDNARPDARKYTTHVVLNGHAYSFIETAAAIDNPSGAVLIAGDSFTSGAACSDHRNFPSAFSRAAAEQGAKLHAVNLGVPGTGPMAYLARAQDYIKEKGPAAGLILTLYANDVEIDCFACQQIHLWAETADLSADDRQQLDRLCQACQRQRTNRAASEVAGDVGLSRRLNWWLAEHSLAFLAFREGVAKIAAAGGALPRDWGRGSYPQRWSNLDGIYFKYLRGVIGLAKQEGDQHGMRVMVVIYPDPTNITNENEFVRVYEKVSHALEQHTGVGVHSGYAAFLGNPQAASNMTFSFSDSHPNCEAHQIMGQWVFDTWSKSEEPPDDARNRGEKKSKLAGSRRGP